MNSKTQTILVIAFLVVFALFLYLPYINVKEFEGEEGRRVLIALQMLETKKFLIPQIFGKLYFSKPPFFNWILAFFFYLTKNFSEFMARAVSSLMALGTSIFITYIWKKSLETSKIKISFWILLIPALIFLTTPEVIDKAIRAEIDMTYTFIITLALFSWFCFSEIKNKKTLAFITGGFFLGLGILTKTFQALTFFYLAIIPYLFIKKRYKELFGLSHLLGIFTYCFVFLIWAIPVNFKVGLNPFIKAWVAEYHTAASTVAVSLMQHLKSFTFSALLGYSPWIFFLILYRRKDFRKKFLNTHPVLKDLALFSICLFGFSYLFYLIFPGSRLRYILPSAGGFVFLAAISNLYFFVYPQKFWQASFWKYFSYFLAGILLVSSLVFFIYIKFHFQQLSLFLYFNLLLLISLCFYFLIKAKNKKSFNFIFLFFVLIVFFVKQIYVSFYYPYHKQKFNYYRKAATELAQILKKDNYKNGVLYIYQDISNHLIYYLKYKIKAINNVKVLTNCQQLPVNQWVLVPKKYLSDFYLNSKDYQVNYLKIRKRDYFLVKQIK